MKSWAERLEQDVTNAIKVAWSVGALAAVSCTEVTMIGTLKDGKMTEKQKQTKLNRTLDSISKLSLECGVDIKAGLHEAVNAQGFAYLPLRGSEGST